MDVQLAMADGKIFHDQDRKARQPTGTSALIEALGDSLAAAPEHVPVPDWHKALIDERIAEDDADQTAGEGLSAIRSRLENSP